MDWGRVIFIFFALMSLTTTAGFLYEENMAMLLFAAIANMISTLLKIGVKNILSAELFASSLVADLHLVPAFLYLLYHKREFAFAYAIGAIVANLFSMIIVSIEATKIKEEF